MNPTKKTFFIMLFTAVFASLFTYFVVVPAAKVDTSPMKQGVKTEQKQVQSIDQNYTENLNTLKKKNDSLLAVINTYKAAYMISNQKVLALENRVTDITTTVNKEPDTSKQKIKDCDTLGKIATILIVQEDKRDSLCENEVNELTTLVQNKDSAISVCTKSYLNMRQVADTSMKQQQFEIGQITKLNHKLKWKRAESKILSAGLLIISGVAATLYISPRKL
jgi:ribosome-binding protein aMBF1 (putative translation factor)